MKYLTTAQVAKKLGITIRRVQALITTGRLPAEKLGQIYLIDPKQLPKVRHRPLGWPKGRKRA